MQYIKLLKVLIVIYSLCIEDIPVIASFLTNGNSKNYKTNKFYFDLFKNFFFYLLFNIFYVI